MRYHSRPALRKSGEHRSHQRPKHRDVVARCVNDDNRERKISKTLLIFQVAVDCEEKVELSRGQLQQFTVFHTGPPRLGNGRNIVAKKGPYAGRGGRTRQAARASAIKWAFACS